MKRIASWLRQIANELDPPAKRGRPSKRAERNAAAVDSLFANSERAQAIEPGGEFYGNGPLLGEELPHGWPQEPGND